MLKKDEETKRLRRVNDTLKEIIEPRNRMSNKRSTVMPHLQQHQHQQHEQAHIDYAELVHRIVGKLLCEAELQAEIERYER